MSHGTVLPAIGVVIGLLSGLFGVGGSSIATPLLRLLGVPAVAAVASPLPVTLPIALVGGLVYRRRGLVNRRVVLWTAVGGMPAVVLGSWLTGLIPGRVLMALTGLFVTAVGILVLRPASGGGAARRRTPYCPAVLVGVGAVVGFLSGLLANGGGFLLIPVYLILCRMDTQEAAATSLVGVALLAVPGTVAHWQLGHIDPRLVLPLILGAVPATWLGARLGLNLSPPRSRWLFGSFLLLFGLFFLFRTVYRAEVHGWLG